MTPAKYDDVLHPFLTLMRRELHANAGKGDRPGWLAMSPDQALLEVYYHLAKLQKAVKHNDGPAIQEYSADVANMAMMVLDICGGLVWVDYSAAPGRSDAAPGERQRFECWVARTFPTAPLTHHPFKPDSYDGVLAEWTWRAWQARAALGSTIAGVDSVAEPNKKGGA